jgi:hypothetical protein
VALSPHEMDVRVFQLWGAADAQRPAHGCRLHVHGERSAEAVQGIVTDPKTRKSKGAVPALQQRLEMHRLRCGDPQSGSE